MPSYAESSRRLGSIMRNFTVSGAALKRILQIMALRDTLFPEPVVPAIRRCGILTRSARTGAPTMSSPRAMGSRKTDEAKFSLSRTSRRCTASRSKFGISMPMAALPGMGAMIRTLGAFRARARSSARFVIRLIFTPGAGSSSYIVMTGPALTSMTLASTPKSASFFSRMRELARRLSRLRRVSRRSAASRSLSGGSVNDSLLSTNSKRVCSAGLDLGFSAGGGGSSITCTAGGTQGSFSAWRRRFIF
ncbi:MAG: hypothetical protein A4E73_03857 [Syntrophaceae bacterium PtaU1.Bin231]|nr:MAG: hypothetical protein A4E73_03857 [Syntrophaceae bacterium PtaU1.Bin231]